MLRFFAAFLGVMLEDVMERSERVSFLAENALEMIFDFDEKGTITYANAAAMDKLEYGDGLCGRHISEIFPNTFRQTEDGFATDYAFGQEICHLAAYRKNLTCFPVEARIVKDGSYVCMANDILEKEFLNKEIEQVKKEAKQAMKVKSEFVANITHELRTPVNGILGNVRELFHEELDKKTLRSLRLVERCCEDMNKIINNILDFSKLEAGKFVLEPRRFHFRNMLNYVRSNHVNKLAEKGLGFFMTVSPQIPEYVIGDELRIVQILGNLISNAQKFTSVGKVSVEVVRTARVKDKIELFFMVKDTGIGIDDADKEKLFKSFSQVDASISRKYGGTGLGLNICKQLVDLMGGSIEVESEKNKGSTFSFSIWVSLCEEEEQSPVQENGIAVPFFSAMDEEVSVEDIRKFGTAENLKSLENNLSKLILCVEMENWEKAEMFVNTVRELTGGAPREVGRVVLRLKMAIQKENYDKIMLEFEELNRMLKAYGGETQDGG